jgi:hypothetical protein
LALAALILAGEGGVGEHPPLLLRIAGQTVLERQIRQAQLFGAVHTVLLVSALPAAILAIIDQLKADGVSVDLARDAHDASDRFHPDEDILVFDGAIVVENDLIELVIARSGAVIVTSQSDGAGKSEGTSAGFERIDATDYWAGIAKIGGGVLRETSAMLGDWVFGPTLLRCAVQQGAQRMPLPNSALELPIRPTSQEEASRLAIGFAHAVRPSHAGWFDHFVLSPVARALTPRLVQKNFKFKMLEIVSILLYLCSIIAGLGNYPLIAYSFFLVAMVPAQLSQIIRNLVVSGGLRVARLLQWRSAMLVLLILILAARAVKDGHYGMGLILALWYAVQWAQGKFLFAEIAKVTSVWRSDAGAQALILIASSLFSIPLVGLGVCIALTIADPLLMGNKRTRP